MTAHAMPPKIAQAAMHPSWLTFEFENSIDNIAKSAPSALPINIAPNLSDVTTLHHRQIALWPLRKCKWPDLPGLVCDCAPAGANVAAFNSRNLGMLRWQL